MKQPRQPNQRHNSRDLMQNQKGHYMCDRRIAQAVCVRVEEFGDAVEDAVDARTGSGFRGDGVEAS